MAKEKRFILLLSQISACLLGLVIAYYLLLHNGQFFSIDHLFLQFAHTSKNHHLLVIALLPIYISTMVFGSVLTTLYVETRVITHLFKSKWNKKN